MIDLLEKYLASYKVTQQMAIGRYMNNLKV